MDTIIDISKVIIETDRLFYVHGNRAILMIFLNMLLLME